MTSPPYCNLHVHCLHLLNSIFNLYLVQLLKKYIFQVHFRSGLQFLNIISVGRIYDIFSAIVLGRSSRLSTISVSLSCQALNHSVVVYIHHHHPHRLYCIKNNINHFKFTFNAHWLIDWESVESHIVHDYSITYTYWIVCTLDVPYKYVANVIPMNIVHHRGTYKSCEYLSHVSCHGAIF